MEGDTGPLRSEHGRGGSNAVEFVPDQPDEMGLWPKGVVFPCGWWWSLVGVGVS